MEKVFFVIPVYNVEAYLRRCVKSVLAQTYPNIEVILIDDGSPDGSPQICDEYGEKYENIKVIHKANGGLSDARNVGLDLLREISNPDDFVTFLDADDYVHEDYAAHLVELAKQYNCNMVQCDYKKGSADEFGHIENSVNTFWNTSEDALLGYTLKSQCCPKLYRVSIFDDIRFPLGHLNEDEFVGYKTVYKAQRIAFTNEPLYYYYQRPNSIMDNIASRLKNNPHRYDYLKAYEERISFFKEKNLTDQVLKTHEKICTDIILRYCEQMYLNPAERDTDCTSGKYLDLYKNSFKIMIIRKNIPFVRRMMYRAFYVFPYSAVIMGKVFTLRK